jgi:HD superfamily phosphohydrolase
VRAETACTIEVRNKIPSERFCAIIAVPESRTIRDPIHRFIKLNEQETEIIDSEAFQRLRHLRQLAFAYLVYPGATHTRFEHSLGVCHVAGLLARKLGFDEDQTKLVRLAALLHDLGHGPFSHVSEEALERYSDHDKLPPKTHKIHELITTILIREDPQIARSLAQNDREKIVNALGPGHGEPILKNVLSGPLDADKQDYLLRDSYYCGVQYGMFDLPQLHEVLCNIADPAGDRTLMIESDGIHTLEQFVLAKYYMTTQVVRHRIRLITDQMLIRAIILGVEQDKIDEIRALYAFDGSFDFIKRYAAWGDTRLLQTFSSEQFEGRLSHFLFSGLLRRRLLKLVFRKPVIQFAPEAREALSAISKPQNADKRRRIEMLLCDEIQKHARFLTTPGGDPSHFVIVHGYTLKSVKEEARNDEASILVNETPPILFESASVLFNSINEKLSEAFVEVYAPVEYHTPAERRNVKNKLSVPIATILEGASQ